MLDVPPEQHAADQPAPRADQSAFAAAIDQTLDRARNCLLSKQGPDGHWCGELQGDSILESEYILLMWILGKESDPALPLIAD
jgi:squalene-hopene/tetraprenyl-beta-curcumene cyclase